MIKIAVVIGTRPEAIKMAPVILELKKFPRLFELIVITSGQHKEMFDNPMSDFKISPDYDLKIMHLKQSLIDINKRILSKLGQILRKEKPNLVLIQGDTPTAFSGALVAFYNKILSVKAGFPVWRIF